jgi:hypothetical protein
VEAVERALAYLYEHRGELDGIEDEQQRFYKAYSLLMDLAMLERVEARLRSGA